MTELTTAFVNKYVDSAKQHIALALDLIAGSNYNGASIKIHAAHNALFKIDKKTTGAEFGDIIADLEYIAKTVRYRGIKKYRVPDEDECIGSRKMAHKWANGRWTRARYRMEFSNMDFMASGPEKAAEELANLERELCEIVRNIDRAKESLIGAKTTLKKLKGATFKNNASGGEAAEGKKMRRADREARPLKTSAPRAKTHEVKTPEVPKIEVKGTRKIRV